jgi:hypothetical protein
MFFKSFVKKLFLHMIIPDELVHELIGEEQSISFCLWKQLPDHAVQILEEAGYTKYDRKTDSIVFVEK